ILSSISLVWSCSRAFRIYTGEKTCFNLSSSFSQDAHPLLLEHEILEKQIEVSCCTNASGSTKRWARSGTPRITLRKWQTRRTWGKSPASIKAKPKKIEMQENTRPTKETIEQEKQSDIS
uniref:Uncharacterized protein n=1 Tax=Mustela putorius furo TaxID=9669 RepID=M3XYP9_MUSPF